MSSTPETTGTDGKNVPQKKVLSEVGTYVVGLSEELKKVYPYKLDGKCQPELIVGRSEILDIKDVLNISDHILGETSWVLAYSSSLHVHSLTGMYDKLQGFYENGIQHLLILVKDKQKRLFGTFVSTQLACAEEKYAAEYSVLFQCTPNFEIIGENQCIVKCRKDSLEIGDSEGKYSFSLDETLKNGKLEECAKISTKVSGPNSDVLFSSTKSYPFQIRTLECWMFGSK